MAKAKQTKTKSSKAKTSTRKKQTTKKQTTKRTYPSAETAREMFMQSDHVDWPSFAKSNGWPVQQTTRAYPVGDWTKEKKQVIGSEQAEALAGMIFKSKTRWHESVLQTLEEYPQTHDALHTILKHRINTMLGKIRRDEMARAQGVVGHMSEFEQVKTSEILKVSMALKMITESKHKALMINNWSFRLADHQTEQFENELADTNSQVWQVEIIGKQYNTKTAKELLGKWYDQPSSPHDYAAYMDDDEDEDEDDQVIEY
jgi:hypothetical protein